MVRLIDLAYGAVRATVCSRFSPAEKLLSACACSAHSYPSSKHAACVKSETCEKVANPVFGEDSPRDRSLSSSSWLALRCARIPTGSRSRKPRSSAAVACIAYQTASTPTFEHTEVVLGVPQENLVRMAEALDLDHVQNRDGVASGRLPAVLEMALPHPTLRRATTGKPRASNAALRLHSPRVKQNSSYSYRRASIGFN